MKVPSRAMSRPSSIVCPACGCGELKAQGLDLVECNSCGHAFEGAVLWTLEEITSLPDAVGKHSCECGHPEMRRSRIYLGKHTRASKGGAMTSVIRPDGRVIVVSPSLKTARSSKQCRG